MEENISQITDDSRTLNIQPDFLALFSEKFRQAQRHQEPLGLLQLDVDHFKPYVHQYGESVAQQLLLTINTALKSIFKEPHIVYHTGHDEFFVILWMTPLSQALPLAEKSRQHIADLNRNQNEASTIPRSVTLSIGICAKIPAFSDTVSQWLSWTQEALALAKQTGRNCSRTISHDEYC